MWTEPATISRNIAILTMLFVYKNELKEMLLFIQTIMLRPEIGSRLPNWLPQSVAAAS